ncbi:MAG: sugar transferase [Coleofasciculaceae cyanobacterium]
MTYSTTLLDLRSPALKQFSRRNGLACFPVTLIFLLADSLLLTIAWLTTQTYNFSISYPWSLEQSSFALVSILVAEIGLVVSQGLFRTEEKRRDYFSLAKTILFAHVLVLIVGFFLQPDHLVIPRSTFLFSLVIALAFTTTGRVVGNTIIDSLRRQGTALYPVFLIGNPQDTTKARAILEKENRYKILGWADITSADRVAVEVLLDKIHNQGATEVFLCSWGAVKNRMFLYWSLRNAGITLHTLPIGLEPISHQAELKMIGGLPSLTSSPPLITGTDFWVKRCFDFCSSALILTLASPLYLFIALLIRLDSPGPIFYKQTRVGLHNQQFKVWKFRTMVVNADKLQKELEARNEMQDGVLFKLKDDPRITRVGKFLRQYSLDELPQVFNVLFGQMSLVGPRPLPLRDVENFSKHHFVRHEVLPGITGLWQVSGRSDIVDFDQAVRLDVSYIENWSLCLDLQILLETVNVVLKKKGAY